MRTISVLGGVSLLALCVTQARAADPAADPWALPTPRDLQTIHDTLAANHPGPVDPRSDRYRRWLEEGLQVAKAEAARARQYSDYTRAVRRYVNGFRDGHTTTRFLLSSERVAWPGFLVGRDAAEKIRVLAAAADSNVPRGAELVACNGTATEQLIKERLDPYYWNADLPHERWNSLPKLFQFEPVDTAGRMTSCTFRIDGVAKSIELRWANAPRETVTRYVQDMQPRSPALGLQQRQGIWFVALAELQLLRPVDRGHHCADRRNHSARGRAARRYSRVRRAREWRRKQRLGRARCLGILGRACGSTRCRQLRLDGGLARVAGEHRSSE